MAVAELPMGVEVKTRMACQSMSGKINVILFLLISMTS
jgi:hypothetical protein